MTRRRRLGGMLGFAAAAAAILAGSMSKGSGMDDMTRRVKSRFDDDEPCQPGASDYWEGRAVNRHELRTRKEDQKRFQNKQQAKFNMKGRK